jgi:hypothetical protein
MWGAGEMKDLPKTITIGHFPVRIELVDELDGGKSWGGFEVDTNVIKLVRKMPRGIDIDTLWHEIQHAIFTLSRIRGGDDEERIVTVMATWQIKVLKDNPKLLAWITRELKS